jgi:acyl-CoA oxidase
MKDMMSLKLPGCFAMTETGHGSNVRGLETTATYDKDSGEFIIHSPTVHAGKEYIGNALHSKMAVVFAQLIVDEKSEGVHAFLVPLRDENHNELEGIKVEDNGYKMGLNGVDNGKIWFTNVRIPRENLLDKYGKVDEKGNYSSPIKKASKRFFTMLGALVQGRVSIAMGANASAKKSLTIAIKYALKRRQFSQTAGAQETLILDYPSHQKRLFSRLARTYSYHFGLEALRKKFVEKKTDADVRKVESLAAGLKAMVSWHATDTIQE